MSKKWISLLLIMIVGGIFFSCTSSKELDKVKSEYTDKLRKVEEEIRKNEQTITNIETRISNMRLDFATYIDKMHQDIQDYKARNEAILKSISEFTAKQAEEEKSGAFRNKLMFIFIVILIAAIVVFIFMIFKRKAGEEEFEEFEDLEEDEEDTEKKDENKS